MNLACRVEYRLPDGCMDEWRKKMDGKTDNLFCYSSLISPIPWIIFYPNVENMFDGIGKHC